MEQTVKTENKMGTMPVNKLLVSMALPIVISMIVQAFYNVVDSIYVAKLSEDALTAVSLAFPISELYDSYGKRYRCRYECCFIPCFGRKTSSGGR